MQVTIDIPDQVAAEAATLGVSVEQYVRSLLMREPAALPAAPKLRSSQEVGAWLERLAQFSDSIPELPDEALTRESFYQDHD